MGVAKFDPCGSETPEHISMKLLGTYSITMSPVRLHT